MGFFRVKAGLDKETIVNRECGAKLVLDFLKNRLGITNKEVELDLCDEWGNMRFLTQVPPRCSCVQLVASRALYTPVLIKRKPAITFEFPMGRPVATQKAREAMRKVRRQWDKFLKLRNAAGGQFTSDQEAVDIIVQVVGSPSAEWGKSKGKARDPAPKPVRPPRATSAGRKKKFTTAADTSEEKENQLKNNVNQTEQKTVTAGKTKETVSTVSEQSKTIDNATGNVKGQSKTPSTDTGAKEVAETGQSETPSEQEANPKVNVPLKDIEAIKVPGDRQINEPTDSGIESAARQSINVEAGRNEESNSGSVLSQSKTKLKHRRSLDMPAIPEQDDAITIKNNSPVPQTKIQSYDKEGKLSGNAEETPISVLKIVPEENGDVIRNGPDDTASDATQTSPVTNTATTQTTCATESIMPPNDAERRRVSSVDVTALLDLGPAEGTERVAPDVSTRRSVPSAIDREWRTKQSAHQLTEVMSGASQLMYLGSVKSSSSATCRQLDVINTTTTAAERLGVQTATLTAANPVQNAAPSGTGNDGREGDVSTPQRLHGPVPWKSPLQRLLRPDQDTR